MRLQVLAFVAVGFFAASGCAGILDLSEDFHAVSDDAAAPRDGAGTTDGGDGAARSGDDSGERETDGSIPDATTHDGASDAGSDANSDAGSDVNAALFLAHPTGSFSGYTFSDDDFALVVDGTNAYLVGTDSTGYLVVITVALPSLTVVSSAVLTTSPIVGVVDDARLLNGSLYVSAHVSDSQGTSTLSLYTYAPTGNVLTPVASQTVADDSAQVDRIVAAGAGSVSAVGTVNGAGARFEFRDGGASTFASLPSSTFVNAYDSLDVDGGTWVVGNCENCEENDDLASYALLSPDGGIAAIGTLPFSTELDPTALTEVLSTDAGLLAYGAGNTSVILTPLPPTGSFPTYPLPDTTAPVGFQENAGISRAVSIGGGHFVAVATSFGFATGSAFFCFDETATPDESCGDGGFYFTELGHFSPVAAMGIEFASGNLYSAFLTGDGDWALIRRSF